ncbi:methylated-DNA--[protein]-cysteine S-methyltransferase [Tuberibacillus sp. Marseille-P3662]|uniref:methylated-DNA--[protein]-cysteine S-methyltransferase n=1 Tax=Tuberibacillus sp. Marseille-P3662 TaxID=1965358 RepID=UPI000A1CD317|nr:methylated-DNA--[protein]-cysteine S-methyltransferase [Tuberibacillus sp. Marseille-P3662]
MSKRPCLNVEEMDSAIGHLTITSIDTRLCKIAFGDLNATLPTIQGWAKHHMLHNEIAVNQGCTHPIVEQLQEYLDGDRQTFSIDLELMGTPFQKKVWRVLMEIGYGEIKTYKDIAESIGQAKAVRAIGSANNRNPIPIIIPCHRVIGTNGSLVGYGGGLDIKHQLLQLEKAI